MKISKYITLLSAALGLGLFLSAQTPFKVIPTNRKNISKILFDGSGNNAYYSSSTTIYNVNVGIANINPLCKHSWVVSDFSISHDGKYIYSADGRIQIWASGGNKVISDLGKLNNIKKIAVSPNDQYFTYCSMYKFSNALLPEYFIQNFPEQSEKIASITHNDNGSLLAVGYEKNGVDIWNILENKLISSFNRKIGAVTYLSFSNNNKHLLIGTSNGALITWDIKEKKVTHQLLGRGKSIIGVFQVNNYIVVSVDSEGYIDAVEYKTGKIIKKLKTENIIQCVDYSNEKNLVVFARNNGDLVFYDIFNMLNLPATKYYVLLDSISTDVKSNLFSWEKRGKYEKTENYLDRVNKQNRDIKVEELTNEATNKFGLRLLKSKKTVLNYDPDNEYYQITVEDLAPIFVYVPIDEAPSFEMNYVEMKIRDIKFVLADNQVYIQNATFINPENDRIYKYTNTDQTTFNKSDISLNFEDIKVDIPESEQVNSPSIIHRKIEGGIVDVDKDIPENKMASRVNTYALVIGNEDYSTYQTNLSSEINVDYAVNDAEVVGEYMSKTIGVPEKNITILKNATYGQMMRAINKLEVISEITQGEAELIFYYSGHGFPNEKTNEAYIMPVDASATTLESAIQFSEILKKLTNFSSRRVLVIIDACFSGGGRNQGLLAMKGMKMITREAEPSGNLVVISSSTGEESSGVYREKQHGMFTYYFLKKIQETKGHLTLKELADYVKEKVELESVIINSKRQTPQVLYSPDVNGIWESWRLVEEIIKE